MIRLNARLKAACEPWPRRRAATSNGVRSCPIHSYTELVRHLNGVKPVTAGNRSTKIDRDPG
jgi:hypothetical protein